MHKLLRISPKRSDGIGMGLRARNHSANCTAQSWQTVFNWKLDSPHEVLTPGDAVVLDSDVSGPASEGLGLLEPRAGPDAGPGLGSGLGKGLL